MLENIKTITLINLGYIGDVINSSPVCIELKKKYPDSKIIYITLKPSYETAKYLPNVDEVLVYDRRGDHKGFKKLVKLAFSIRKNHKIDLAILLTDSFRCAFFAFLLGAKKRLGRVCQNRSIFLTNTIPFLKEEYDMKIHISEHYMRLLKPLGLYKSDYKFSFNFSEKDNVYINEILNESDCSNKKLIGFCPCARLEGKNWWPKDAAEFIKIINKTTDYKVAIVGDDSDITAKFVQDIRNFGQNNFIDITGKTTIAQLGAIIAKCDKFVSVDTGSMHLAFALNIPTVALFYYDCVTKWGPKDKDKNRIILNPDRHGIKAQEVIEKLNEL